MSLETRIIELALAVGADIKGKISSIEKGEANGVATLDSGSRIPESQLPLALEQALAAINGV